MDCFPPDFKGAILSSLRADTQLRQKRPDIVKIATEAAMRGDSECVIDCTELCFEAKRKLVGELCRIFGFVYSQNERNEWDRVDVFTVNSTPVRDSYLLVFR